MPAERQSDRFAPELEADFNGGVGVLHGLVEGEI